MGQVNRARIIGYLPNGKPVREIRGGSQPPAETPAGGQQGQGQDSGDVGDLIGSAATPDPQGQQGQQQGDPLAAGEQPPAWFAQGLSALESKVTSEIDRRINQLENRRNRGGQQGDQGQQGGGQQGQNLQVSTGLDPRDVRDARGVFRDSIRDAQLTPGERELVNTVSGGVVQATLARLGDPDQAGEQAAKDLASAVTALRASHQKDLLARLRAIGAIDESKLRQGTPQQQGTTRGAAPGQQANPGQQFAGGVSKAQELAARRGLVTPGAAQPGQQ